MNLHLKIAAILILASSLFFTACGEKKADNSSLLLLLLGGHSAGDMETFTADGVSFKMAFLPGGITLMRGREDSWTDTVANAYLIGETEVTYELWNAVRTWATSNGYTFANDGVMGDGSGDTIHHPATTINWRDAIIWCNAATEWYNANKGTNYTCVYYSDLDYKTQLKDATNSTDICTTEGCQDKPFIQAAVNGNTDMSNCTATGFRLLTRNEWELAARYISDADNDGDITDAGEYYPGNFSSGADAQYDATSGGTDIDGDGDIDYSTNVAVFDTSSAAIVKSKHANALGLYDMSGNVMEWCFEAFGTARMDPGGWWGANAASLELGDLTGHEPYSATDFIGFRLGKNAQ
jgi:formylglycine-generating enzyme